MVNATYFLPRVGNNIIGVSNVLYRKEDTDKVFSQHISDGKKHRFFIKSDERDLEEIAREILPVCFYGKITKEDMNTVVGRVEKIVSPADLELPTRWGVVLQKYKKKEISVRGRVAKLSGVPIVCMNRMVAITYPTDRISKFSIGEIVKVGVYALMEKDTGGSFYVALPLQVLEDKIRREVVKMYNVDFSTLANEVLDIIPACDAGIERVRFQLSKLYGGGTREEEEPVD